VPKPVLIGILIAAALLSAWINYRFWRTPDPVEPTAINSEALGVTALDLLDAPDQAEFVLDGETVNLPGSPLRFIVARNQKGFVHLAWSNSPDHFPDEALQISTQTFSVSAYVAEPGRAIVQCWRSWDEARGGNTLTISYR
jgi:hypothetical protein